VDGTTQPAGVPAQLVEEVLAEEGRKLFPLKKGGEIDGAIGQAIWEMLQDLYDQKPQLFASLLAIAEDRGAGVPLDHVAALQHDLFLRGDDATVVSDVKAVLLSSAKTTTEGLTLVNPFRVTSEAEAAALQQSRDDLVEKYRRMIRDDNDADKGRPPGRR